MTFIWLLVTQTEKPVLLLLLLLLCSFNLLTFHQVVHSYHLPHLYLSSLNSYRSFRQNLSLLRSCLSYHTISQSISAKREGFSICAQSFLFLYHVHCCFWFLYHFHCWSWIIVICLCILYNNHMILTVIGCDKGIVTEKQNYASSAEA